MIIGVTERNPVTYRNTRVCSSSSSCVVQIVAMRVNSIRKTGASQIPIYGEAGMYFIPTWLHGFGSVFYSHCVVTVIIPCAD